MASYRGIKGVLDALKDHFDVRIEGHLDQVVSSPAVSVLGTQELSTVPSGNHIGLYLHRISVDPFGRNRYLQPLQSHQKQQPELAVNLHILLIAWTNEGPLLGWAMQQIGSSLDLNIAHLSIADERWGEAESLQIIPEDMDTENLLYTEGAVATLTQLHDASALLASSFTVSGFSLPGQQRQW